MADLFPDLSFPNVYGGTDRVAVGDAVLDAVRAEFDAARTALDNADRSDKRALDAALDRYIDARDAYLAAHWDE